MGTKLKTLLFDSKAMNSKKSRLTGDGFRKDFELRLVLDFAVKRVTTKIFVILLLLNALRLLLLVASGHVA